ncbi:flagellar basal body-associated protein FliL [Neobacillus terrae]|uniref:flagellar basal body-associated protein FliL n=1 Tax=Neobacillus terrae TaxID=3034837 RepID=UPI001409A3FC|nr:flagellar basal body-associated protein FliL [Neobacillus terrae]NHM29802.1 flagellar basal body-associated protein FliL [Neobacillus terrae]
MMKNKLFMIMTIMLAAILLVGGVAVTVIYKMNNKAEAKGPTIDEVLEDSVDIPQLTTNLASDDYIRISFKIQTDSTDAKDEVQKRDFQVKNIIIQELSEKQAKDLQGKEGKLQLENALKHRINQLMQNGKVVKVYITDSLLQ